jgi:hypothetical protein
VTLWDRGDAVVGDGRYCAISAWAFRNPLEWQTFRPKASPEQLDLARYAAGAMMAFDTWVAASDRKNDHILVSDDGDLTALKLAYIDYAFALSYEWIGVVAPQAEPRAAFPSDIPVDQTAMNAIVSAIEGLEERQLGEIVNRIPADYYVDGAHDAIIKGLLDRRGQLRGWLGLSGG